MPRIDVTDFVPRWCPIGGLGRRSWASLGAPVLLGLALITQPAAAESWSGTLSGGGQVLIDPRTNRPTVTIDGEETQLWDGVHRLDDGRELTVESGRVVPNQEILESRRPLPPSTPLPEAAGGAPILGRSPCEVLVGQVCGADGACAAAEACGPARQLLEMEREEQREAGTPGRTTYTSEKCLEAQRDDFFAPCPHR
jgi:hypothetical protein